MHRILFLFALAAAMSTGPAAAGKIYKWTDSDGRVHYGANPPRGAPAARVDVRTSGPATPPARDQAEAEDSGAGPGEEEAQEQQADATPGSPEFLRQQCQLARQNLDVLEAGGVRARYRSSEGEVVRYTEEELQAEVERNEMYVEEYCQDI